MENLKAVLEFTNIHKLTFEEIVILHTIYELTEIQNQDIEFMTKANDYMSRFSKILLDNKNVAYRVDWQFQIGELIRKGFIDDYRQKITNTIALTDFRITEKTKNIITNREDVQDIYFREFVKVYGTQIEVSGKLFASVSIPDKFRLVTIGADPMEACAKFYAQLHKGAKSRHQEIISKMDVYKSNVLKTKYFNESIYTFLTKFSSVEMIVDEYLHGNANTQQRFTETL